MESSDDKVSLHSYKTYPDKVKILKDYEVLVLSGGGTKGVITLGMLHRLSENNLSNIKFFVGTSIGSVICFLMIIGLTPVEILSYICTKNICMDTKLNILQLLSKGGMMSFDTFFDEIQRTTEERLGFIPTMFELYEQFNKEFVCVTHNLTTNKTVYIDHISHPNLSCIEALKMSCNIPLIFEKYMYDKCFYVDGAVSDNFAIEYTSKRYYDKKILGLYIETHSSLRENNQDIMVYIKSLLTVSFRMNCSISKEFKSQNINTIMATVSDNYPEWNFNLSDNSKRFDLFSIGYKLIDEIEGISSIEELNKIITKLKTD